MGGHALKIKTVRLAAPDYYAIEKKVCDQLTTLFTSARVACIHAYRNKPDFGDMDVLVESNALPNDWIDLVQSAFTPKEIVKNGPVLSFDVDNFQIDLVLIPSDRFDFALRYYSWNDCGNLVGRVAKGLGFKFGHEGFFYVFRDKDRYQDTLLVSRDFDKVLTFLGYNPQIHCSGFDELVDMFEFVADTPYFRNESFLLEYQNHTSRVRIKKRPSYTKFLAYIKELDKPSFMLDDREGMKHLFLEGAFNEFPGFKKTYEYAQIVFERKATLKSKFNGPLVQEITGLNGVELGQYMAKLKSQFSSSSEFDDFIHQASPESIRSFILNLQKNR